MELKAAGIGVAARLPVDTLLSSNPIYFDKSVLKAIESDLKQGKECNFSRKNNSVYVSVANELRKISLDYVDGNVPCIRSGLELEAIQDSDGETVPYDLRLATKLHVAVSKVSKHGKVKMKVLARGFEYKFYEAGSRVLIAHAVLLGVSD